MPVAPFDTLHFASRLKAAGVPTPQAEAQASALGDAFRSVSIDQASTADVREAVQELRSEIHALAAELRAETHALRMHVETAFARVGGELNLLRWMVGLLLAGIASLVLKAFF